MVTMTEVATKAGVSQATVSLVLGGRADRLKISPETRERVLGAARELGYQRNQLARAMVTGKSRIIGVLTTPHVGENFVRILTGAMEAANAHDYLLKVLHLSHDTIDDGVISRCMEWRLAGAMVVGLSEASQRRLHDEFRNVGLSLALIDSAPLPEWGVRVLSDDDQGIHAVVSHLVGLGHQKIAFLGGRPGELSARRERSFRDAIAEAGLETPEAWIRNGSWSDAQVIEEGARAILRESDALGRPTAIACSADNIAMSVLRIARSLGLRLPDELSVTGYSNMALSAFADPPLTTVDQSFRDMGYEAAMHLIGRAEQGEDVSLSISPNPEVLLPTQLIERGSAAPPLSPAR